METTTGVYVGYLQVNIALVGNLKHMGYRLALRNLSKIEFGFFQHQQVLGTGDTPALLPF